MTEKRPELECNDDLAKLHKLLAFYNYNLLEYVYCGKDAAEVIDRAQKAIKTTETALALVPSDCKPGCYQDPETGLCNCSDNPGGGVAFAPVGKTAAKAKPKAQKSEKGKKKKK